ncbi:MAG: cytochrome C [Rhodobacterales bacterium 65-51]|uniref:c-type cytochrome n=1 Tax=uncultured Gemmobacter sp. TaxID=1095917 RepID=UPI00095AABFB|nr:cytochrome C [uncultured Gemmobacter sp.]OJY36007.1 MAG: cytochrome C [Rhodobacterales bacterium 65-51]
MTNRIWGLASALAFLAAPALAGDPAKGEADFKKCRSCHAVIAPDGTEIAKGGKTGPNLFGVIGRQIGTAADFKYSESLVAAGADGTVWDEAMIASYIDDPNAWLKEKTGDAAAKSKMTFKLPKGGEDIASWLATLR